MQIKTLDLKLFGSIKVDGETIDFDGEYFITSDISEKILNAKEIRWPSIGVIVEECNLYAACSVIGPIHFHSDGTWDITERLQTLWKELLKNTM